MRTGVEMVPRGGDPDSERDREPHLQRRHVHLLRRHVLQVFEEYQKARVTFVQTVRGQNREGTD